MSIEDRDWYRELRIDYENGGLINRNHGKAYSGKKGSLKKSLLLLLKYSFMLGCIVSLAYAALYTHCYFDDSLKTSALKYSVQDRQYNPSAVAAVPPRVVLRSPSVPQLSVKVSPKKSRVVSSSPDSQTLKYFTKESANIKYLTLEVNGIPIEAMFDTGASVVAFNTETIQKLFGAGVVKSFKGKTSMSTANGIVEGYAFDLSTVRLGTMEVANVECQYAPYTRDNLLGGSFLSNFNYSINETDQTITLTRKDRKG